MNLYYTCVQYGYDLLYLEVESNDDNISRVKKKIESTIGGSVLWIIKACDYIVTCGMFDKVRLE